MPEFRKEEKSEHDEVLDHLADTGRRHGWWSISEDFRELMMRQQDRWFKDISDAQKEQLGLYTPKSR